MSWQDIHGDNDVSILGQTLKRQGFATTVLTNSQTTASNIRTALNTLVQQTNAGDFVYIHFSSHSQPIEDRNGDEKDGWDEAIVPYDASQKYVKGVYEGSRYIIDDELNVFVSKICRRVGLHGFVYVVIDACHADGSSHGAEDDEETVFEWGTSIGFRRSGKPFVPNINTRPVIRITRQEYGWSLLSGCLPRLSDKLRDTRGPDLLRSVVLSCQSSPHPSCPLARLLVGKPAPQGYERSKTVDTTEHGSGKE
jgi:hypothetical protein